ncbi:cytochrome P450 [Aspergillus ibericus CBS 121593]|uniref:Cytochrome P450 monooxygenase n=1 Tax=Aspergillus ibericus CBS 121593 TaxID=1448316 RepID=A0A395H883_9EURO|nr:cytochrome P450 monooxygenase [Aspergillus ibericus CBS 121593]RAL04151.1 cytochrome P450 monooxygenase [Aspergillus ibericus CBS 121593]
MPIRFLAFMCATACVTCWLNIRHTAVDSRFQPYQPTMISSIQTAILAGILSHVAYFHHGEHHLYGTIYLKLFGALYTTSVALLHVSWGTAWMEAWATVSLHATSYLVGVFGSLLVYRLMFNPLADFPGPWAARISSLWFPLQFRNNNRHFKLVELHDRYGPYIRIGPAELSIIDPKANDIIYGSSSPCTKSTFYDHSYPNNSLQTTRDPVQHQQRRRLWSRAFGSKRLRGYDQRIRKYRRKLVDQLVKMNGQPVNANKWFGLYSYDVMGDLAFGEGFGSLERGEHHWAMQLIVEALEAMGIGLPTWLFRMVVAIPGLMKGWRKLLEYSEARLMERMNNEPDVPDISASLLAPLKGQAPDAEERLWLGGDCRLIIVAGSDTTTITLTALFYELAKHPEQIERLRAELTPYVEGDLHEGFLDDKISHLEHLNGVINEALRLYPAVPSAIPRVTPPEGISVNGVFIPGNTTVICPAYVMGRSELSYKKPLEFIPERWYQQPELIHDESAFAPFSIGAYNCIGKPLALQNLRTTVAQLVMTFDVQFAPGFEADKFVERSKDNAALEFGDLDLVFTPRKL